MVDYFPPPGTPQGGSPPRRNRYLPLPTPLPPLPDTRPNKASWRSNRVAVWILNPHQRPRAGKGPGRYSSTTTSCYAYSTSEQDPPPQPTPAAGLSPPATAKDTFTPTFLQATLTPHQPNHLPVSYLPAPSHRHPPTHTRHRTSTRKALSLPHAQGLTMVARPGYGVW